MTVHKTTAHGEIPSYETWVPEGISDAEIRELHQAVRDVLDALVPRYANLPKNKRKQVCDVLTQIAKQEARLAEVHAARTVELRKLAREIGK